MLAPLEDHEAQFQFVLEKAKEWVAEFRPHFLQRYDVFPTLKTTILKSLEYPSALSTLNAAQWNAVMSPILEVCLPKAGVCRKFPHSMVYAPTKYQGLGIPHPFSTQMFHHLDMLLRHPANRTQTGKYLAAVLESHQLETGTSFGIFQQVYDNTAVLTSDTWVKRVWRQLDQYDMFISTDVPSLRLRTKHDRLLIEVFMDLEVDQETLKWLNWCRMFLQVVSVADIVTADGKRIRSAVMNGIRDEQYVPMYEWPRTVRPSKSHWQVWRDSLTAALLNPAGTLRRPLTHWKDSIDEWRWLYSPSNECLFHRHNHLWVVYQKMSARANTKRSTSTFQRIPSQCWSGPIPTDILRATVANQDITDFVLLTGVGNSVVDEGPQRPTSILDIWQELSDQANRYLGWVPDEVTIHGSEQALFEALLKGELCVVSDGSSKPPLGTAATIVTTKKGMDRIVTLCQTPGRTEDQCSYRSELCGMFVGLMIADWLVRVWHPLPFPSISRPHVCFGSDGLSALRRAFGNFHIKPTDHHFDMLSAVREFRRHIRFECSFRHIEAHRDRVVHWANLTWWEQMNCEADILAGDYRESLLLSGVHTSPNPRFFSEPSALFIAGIKQSRLDRGSIHELVALPALRDRWSDLGLDQQIEDDISWRHIGSAMNSLQSSLQRWTSKNVVGMCGVGKFMKLWGYTTDDRCPLCSQPEETAAHVPSCTDERAATEWQHQMEVLDHWFASHRTSPQVASSLFQFLQHIRSPMDDPPSTDDPRFQLAFESQNRIGSLGLLEGRLSRHWLPLQEAYLKEIGSPRSINTWASQLVSQLILVGHSMWLHRNSIRHSDDGIQNRDLSRQVNAGIIQQFELGTKDLPPTYHQYLRAGLHRVLARPLVSRRECLQLVSSKRTRTRRESTPQRGIMQRFIDRCRAVTPSPSTR